MKDIVITWPTVAFAAVLCAGFVALVKVAPREWLAPAGIVSIAAGAMLRQAAYKKKASAAESDSDPPPPMPKDLP